MNQDLVDKIRTEVAALLTQPVEGLSPAALHAAIKAGIDSELAARKQAHGARSTLALNALLAAEQAMRLKVFLLPPEPIVGL